MNRPVKSWWTWLVPGAGFLLAVGLTFSPLFGNRLMRLFDDTVQVEARVQACEPVRDGIGHESLIRCRFAYVHDGQTHVAEGPAWRTQNPFLTLAGLQRELQAQSAQTVRMADVRARRPSVAALVDTRWLAMPPLWVWLFGLFVALVTVILRLDPSGMPWRRTELAPDPITGHLQPINANRTHRVRRRIAVQLGAGLLVMAICLFGLSNQPANLVAKASMTGLQPVQARLVDCDHHRRGGYRGHDQIECAFVYEVGGQVLRGQAESLDFRYFPTGKRLDAQAALLQPGVATTAYVDPQHPGYAWAFISDDTFVKFTWGLFELELVVLIIVAGALIVMSMVRWRRSDRPD